VILNGIEVQKNIAQTSSSKGRIAIYHSAKDGEVKISNSRINPPGAIDAASK
jgi:tRNA(Phe) wybutosine-synthesizing methylase Tyw3